MYIFSPIGLIIATHMEVIMKNKHLTFEERLIIEEYLDKGLSVHKISLKLGRPDSSVIREIVRNRYQSGKCTLEKCDKNRSGEELCKKHFDSNDCIYQAESGKKCYTQFCRGCNIMCNSVQCQDYVPYICKRLKKSPYVCNGCNVRKCTEYGSPKYRYQARRAQVCYEDTLKESRIGISLTQEEMQTLDNLVSPLLFNGQSIRAVYANHKDEIPCSESTLYKYVDRCYLTARNIDMPRKVRFKTRYNHGPRSRSAQAFVEDRTYIDFQKYIENNPDSMIWEMDTVIGKIGNKKSLLTLLCRKTSLMIIVLLEEHTQEAIINALNHICETVSIQVFQGLFQVILTDRGTEFGNPYALECDQYGEIKTHVFYCDPYCSWQKGMIERNHEFIRMVLPKGKSFDSLSPKDVHLMMNHINNYPRKSLNNVTPYALSKLLLGESFLDALGYYEIRPDDVILKEKLLKKPRL